MTTHGGITFDSNAITGLVDALSGVACPQDPELQALARCFFHLPTARSLLLLPTVRAEYLAINDLAHRNAHKHWALHFAPIEVVADPAREAELQTRHKAPRDCRIVAECEAAGIATLLTLDQRLRQLLQPVTAVALLLPTELYRSLAIKPGAMPSRCPHPLNPLARESWWRA